MDERTTAVSVDLDDLGCYYGVHGIEGSAPRHALMRWLPRFLDLFDALRIQATFFVIGRDVELDLEGQGEGADVLRAAVAAGHELASHSYAHAYDMSTWSQPQIVADLERCDALLRTVGGTPRGFRAPGYTHSLAMLKAVAEVGYVYDSSALPSPPYYLGKVAVMAAMAARGRKSSSLFGGASSFLGPRAPYRRRDVALVELPMSVTPLTRLPLIGTTVLSGPDAVRRRLVRRASTLPHLHLELHAIDLADPRSEPMGADLPEVRVPLATRRARLEALLRERGPCTRLDELAGMV